MRGIVSQLVVLRRGRSISSIISLTEYERINRRLLELDRLYYDDAESAVTDQEYDELADVARAFEKRYPELVSENSRSLRVGTGTVSSEAKKIEHIDPVLSLTNSYDTERANKLLSRSNNASLLAEPKIDGVSITIRYDSNGKLVSAATRGDGYVGEDVTQAVSRLGNKDVPLSLSNYSLSEPVEVRGEMYMPRELSTEFAHSRNATAGTLKRAHLNPDIVAERGLRFAAYSIATTRRESLETLVSSQSDLLKHLQENWKFSIPDGVTLCHTPEDIDRVVKDFDRLRSTLAYDMDGIVFKTNSIRAQREMGRTSLSLSPPHTPTQTRCNNTHTQTDTARAPRWATAFKYPTKSHPTTLKDITVQVSRLGVLTPVAELEPVRISGATVSRATLHNWSEIKRLNISKGCTVLVERAGEVIPRILRTMNSNDDTKAVEPPTSCPSCDTPVIREGSSDLRCPAGFECDAQREARLQHFAGSRGLGIPGMGSRTISMLCHDMNILRTPVDVFRLASMNKGLKHSERLESRDGWGMSISLFLYK